MLHTYINDIASRNIENEDAKKPPPKRGVFDLSTNFPSSDLP